MPGPVNCANSNPAVLKFGWEKRVSANVVLQDRKISVAGKPPRFPQSKFILGWGSLWQLG